VRIALGVPRRNLGRHHHAKIGDAFVAAQMPNQNAARFHLARLFRECRCLFDNLLRNEYRDVAVFLLA